jgi:hypothetical protein
MYGIVEEMIAPLFAAARRGDHRPGRDGCPDVGCGVTPPPLIEGRMSDDSGRPRNRRWLILLAALLIMSVYCVFCWGFLGSTGALGYPSVETLVRRYLTAVTEGDVGAAVALGRDQCGERVLEDARADTAELSGADIRNLTIDIIGNTGSDEEMRAAHVTFEYRKPGQVEWENSEMHFVIDAQVSIIDLRYLCKTR